MGTVSCRVREERTGGATNGSGHKGVRRSQAGSVQWWERASRGGLGPQRKPATFVPKRVKESINVAAGTAEC